MLLANAANASIPADKFDRELAEHPYIGKLYARSFKSGLRIPAEFRGEWSSDKATCGTDGDDLDTRLFIQSVTVSFGDETHVVTSAKKLGPHSVSLTYGPLIKDYHYMVAPPVLSVSSDGKIIQAWDKSRKEVQGHWMKCPRAKP